MSRTKDMTVGSPAKLILTFALPLMFGNVFQQLYTMVDTIVVGQFVGVEALAALGAADWLNFMILGIVTGFTQGFSILVAQRWGAGDLPGLRRSVTMSVFLSAGIVVATMTVSQLVARPMLLLLNTPENILADALTYLRVCFSGIIVIMAYNLSASILRALGDSKTPLVAMIIAAFINIGLDLLFVVGFQWGVGGAAAATVIAQAFSGIFCILALRGIPALSLKKEDWKTDRPVVGRLFALGIPMAFQNLVIGVGGLVVQSVVNSFGFLFVAGITATNKLYGLLELAATSFGYSMATYTGQNLGAGKVDRIKKGTRCALKMAVVTSLVISALMILFGRHIVRLFISDAAEDVNAVVSVGYRFLVVMSAALFILYMLYVYRSALQGMGDTVMPMVSGIVELATRISVVLLLPHFLDEYGVYAAEPAAWTTAMLLLLVTYYYRERRLGLLIPPGAQNQKES